MTCRRFATALAAVALVLLPATASAQGFEGSVTYAMNPASATPGQLVYQVKGTKIRADVSRATGAPAGGAYTLIDASSGRMMSVMPARKMYMTMDMDAMGEQMKQGTANAKKPVGTITKTGKRETIAGHNCEHYLVGQHQDTDICAAKGLGLFMGGSTAAGTGLFGGLPAGYEKYEEFAKDGFLPLKVSTVRNGREEVVLEARSVVKKRLDPALFAVPAGYQEMDMTKMMQQWAPERPAGN